MLHLFQSAGLLEVAAVAGAAAASLLLASCIVLTTALHGRFTLDMSARIQRTHTYAAPRIGGLALFLGVAWATAAAGSDDARQILIIILAAGLPAFAAGLAEDLTHRVTVRARLAAAAASGLLACAFSGAAITHTGVAVVDQVLTHPWLAVAFTTIAVAGMSNAVNIIDGFHGLASGTVTIALLAIAGIAAQVNDTALVAAALLVAAAMCGFWLVNFPWGKLFLGDGGAYFAGFAVGWLAVLLAARNPSVSPWASVMVCGYPVIEVLYSVARRWSHGRAATTADCEHLHSLIARHVVAPRLRGLDPTLKNAAVSVLMWICAAIPALVGVTFSSSTIPLAMGAAVCVLLYHSLYRRVARP